MDVHVAAETANEERSCFSHAETTRLRMPRPYVYGCGDHATNGCGERAVPRVFFGDALMRFNRTHGDTKVTAPNTDVETENAETETANAETVRRGLCSTEAAAETVTETKTITSTGCN